MRISDWSSDVCSSDLPEEVEEEAARVAALPLHPDKREDLRHLRIVAIDPVDARDFDDAVWAAPGASGDTSGGYQAIVAVADVSYYVRPCREVGRASCRDRVCTCV